MTYAKNIVQCFVFVFVILNIFTRMFFFSYFTQNNAFTIFCFKFYFGMLTFPILFLFLFLFLFVLHFRSCKTFHPLIPSIHDFNYFCLKKQKKTKTINKGKFYRIFFGDLSIILSFFLSFFQSFIKIKQNTNLVLVIRFINFFFFFY